MNQAIRSGNNFSSSNTTVKHFDGDAEVYLHGNHIATVMNNSIIIKDGGWQSNTTKSRLNALLDEFSYGMRVFQKNFEWFVSAKKCKRGLRKRYGTSDRLMKSTAYFFLQSSFIIL